MLAGNVTAVQGGPQSVPPTQRAALILLQIRARLTPDFPHAWEVLQVSNPLFTLWFGAPADVDSRLSVLC